MVCCCVCTTFSFFIWFINATDHIFFRRRQRWLFSKIPFENTHTHTRTRSFAFGYWVDKNNNFIAANRREKESAKKNGTDTYMHGLVCATLITTNTKSNEQWIRILYERVERREWERNECVCARREHYRCEKWKYEQAKLFVEWESMSISTFYLTMPLSISCLSDNFQESNAQNWKTITFWPLLFRSILFSSSFFLSAVFLFFLFLVTPNEIMAHAKRVYELKRVRSFARIHMDREKRLTMTMTTMLLLLLPSLLLLLLLPHNSNAI